MKFFRRLLGIKKKKKRNKHIVFPDGTKLPDFNMDQALARLQRPEPANQPVLIMDGAVQDVVGHQGPVGDAGIPLMGEPFVYTPPTHSDLSESESEAFVFLMLQFYEEATKKKVEDFFERNFPDFRLKSSGLKYDWCNLYIEFKNIKIFTIRAISESYTHRYYIYAVEKHSDKINSIKFCSKIATAYKAQSDIETAAETQRVYEIIQEYNNLNR